MKRLSAVLLMVPLLVFPPLLQGAGLPQPKQIPDLQVLDQNGQTRQFYTDLIKNKTVAINFIFTRCGFTCPLLGVKFGALQRKLNDHQAEPVQLISVSTDPLNDTPQRLKAWLNKYGTEKNWTLVTGEKSTIDQLLKAMQAFAPDINDHSTLILIGNDRNHQWKRLDGQSKVAVLDDALAALDAK